MAAIEIKELSPIETYPIRQAVLWPDKPLSHIMLDQDEEGMHFGAWYQDQLVAVISVFVQGHSGQFRKFATLKAYQSQGIGSQLLNHVFRTLSARGVNEVWCYARVETQAFYMRHGMQRLGEELIRSGKAYVVMTKRV